MRLITAAACAIFAFSAIADTPPVTQPSSSSVTIPLTQFEQMQKSNENASATVIDTVTLGGAFKDRSLTITFAGRSVGTRGATNVIENANDVTLSGCSGDALILRSGKGAYQLVALAPSFTLRCDARLSGSDRLPMNVQPSVLAVRSVVSDGELVAGEENENGVRTFTLVRQVTGPNETLATTATGHYLITLLPDATRFRYAIQVHNPNRSTSPLPLHLASGEHLQQIDSAAPYEVKDGSYVFAMPPGDSTIMLTGELKGTSFAPPVAASLQYVVIESHPLLRPSLQTATKRVSVAEAGVATQYRGALAFEVGQNERLTWSVTRLEALRAVSYAVHNITHTLFIPAHGPVLGESALALDNQGAAEIVLPQKPEPTFVSLQGEPVLMTKNAAGELTVPLSAGSQNVVVQHRQNVSHFGVLATSLDLPRLPVQSTYTHVQLRYPEQWLPLWESFATQGTFWKPSPDALFLFIVFALWLERSLAFLGLPAQRRIAIAVLLALSVNVIPSMMWIVGLACTFVSCVWLAYKRREWRLRNMIAAVVVAGLAIVIVIAVTSLDRSAKRANYETDVVSSAPNLPATARGGNDAPVAPPPPPPEREQAAYQGLPAKFELPGGARSSSFSEQMLATDRPQTIQVVLLSMTVVTWSAIALIVIGAFLLWRDRAMIKNALREKLAGAAAPQEATPA